METTAKLYAFRYSHPQAYVFATLFVAGNILLPQLCHLVPQGGLVLLPIYFFTLIGAYKYGLTVGLLTAVFSPLLNHLLFGMPPAPFLFPILVKSSLLAIAASYMAKRTNKITILALLATVAAYQLAGTVFEWVWKGDFFIAVQDFRLGIPGMIIQIFGGYALLKAIARL